MLKHHFSMENLSSHIISGQKIILNLTEMILVKKRQVLTNNAVDEEFLHNLGLEVQKLESTLLVMKNLINTNQKRKRSEDNGHLENDRSVDSNMVVTKRVKFEGKQVQNDVTCMPKPILKTRDDSNIELVLIRRGDTKGQRKRLPCIGKRIFLVGDSQVLRISGSESRDHIEHNFEMPILALGQSGLKMSEIDLVTKRLCNCCTPLYIVVALAINDIKEKRFDGNLIINCVDVLQRKYGEKIGILFIPPFLNKNLTQANQQDIKIFQMTIENLMEKYQTVKMMEFINPIQIRFQSVHNIHISWNSGPEFWFGILENALKILKTIKITKDEKDMVMSTNQTDISEDNEDETMSDTLNVGIDLDSSDLLPETDQAVDVNLQGLLINEPVAFDEIQKIYKKINKPNTTHIPNHMVKFQFHPESCFLKNYENKSDFNFKLWLNLLQWNYGSLKCAFFDFTSTGEKLNDNFGEIRYILCGTVRDLIYTNDILSLVILNIEGIEFWSKRQGSPETLIFQNCLDPHKQFKEAIVTIISVGQTLKVKNHPTIPAKDIKEGMKLGASVIKSGKRSLARLDLNSQKSGIFATSNFFTPRGSKQ